MFEVNEPKFPKMIFNFKSFEEIMHISFGENNKNAIMNIAIK